MRYSHTSILSIETVRHLLGPKQDRRFLKVSTNGTIDPFSQLGRDIREAAIFDWIVVLKRAKETDIRLVAAAPAGFSEPSGNSPRT